MASNGQNQSSVATSDEERMEAVWARRTVELQEVGGRLQQQYAMMLQQSIQELRVEYDALLNSNKAELDNLYEQKVAHLKSQLKRHQNSLAAKNEESAGVNARNEALIITNTRLQTEKSGLMDKIKALEKKNVEDHRKLTEMLLDRDDDIDRLVTEKNTIMSAYQELMDINVGPDNEISMEDEEELSDSMSPRNSRQDLDGQGRRTPLRSGLKRKRVGPFEGTSADDSYSYEIIAEGTGGIEILEDAPGGKFAKFDKLIAKRETKRVQISHQRKRLGFASEPEELFHQQGEAASERCVIM